MTVRPRMYRPRTFFVWDHTCMIILYGVSFGF
jgi:hypothetical protein